MGEGVEEAPKIKANFFFKKRKPIYLFQLE